MTSCLASNGGRRNVCVIVTLPKEFADKAAARAYHEPTRDYVSAEAVTVMMFDTWTEQTAQSIVKLLERAGIPHLSTFVGKIYNRDEE